MGTVHTSPESDRMRPWLLLILLGLTPLCAGAQTLHTKEIKSSDYTIDRIFRSMRGPSASQTFTLGEPSKKELLWIVGYEAVVVDPKNGQQISQEYLCHSNLDYDRGRYEQTLKTPPLDGRFFTLSQGQQEVKFPKGFGIPIYSDEELTLWTQVLNLNDPKLNKTVKFRAKIHYLKESETKKPMRALVQLGMAGLKSISGKEAHFGMDDEAPLHGPGCSVGVAAVDYDESYKDGRGQEFTGHWVVEPGREVNHTNITAYLALQEDIKVHYVAVHLHPFAESLELRDLTTNKAVFKGLVRPSKGRIGIEHIDHYSSVEGFTLKQGHEYSLISVYNNTSGEPVDSMAVMYLYAQVKDFEANRTRD